MKYCPLVLQYRWRLLHTESGPCLIYYGLRNPPLHREQCVPVSSALASWLARSDADGKSESPPHRLSDEASALAEKGILVELAERRAAKSVETMQVCSRCVVNDYVVPGIEFDAEGVCALCQCYALRRAPTGSAFATVTEEELRSTAAGNMESRFDAMVLYTGGKDSSYTLWMLARKLGLRVLAAFWNMPYCSGAARANIARAQELMQDVEFVEWTLPADMVRNAMLAKWKLQGWPCLCPTAAFPMLYPLAANLRIPYVFLGIEDVQASVLDYVVDQPSAAAPASPRDRTLAFLRTRSLPRPQVVPLRWTDEMANYHAAVRHVMPDLFLDLSALVRRAESDPELQIPLIGRLSTKAAYGSWADARRVIEKDMGWQSPEGQKSMLHTSCSIEPVKDYLQFQRFKAMRTVFMPQSIIETGAAVFFGMMDRDEALASLGELGYWHPPSVLDKLTGDLGITADMVQASCNELGHSMREWADR